ncbi:MULTISPECIES: lysophospholipid acyltransferase family protein [Mesonia]|uniref:Lipid A biosynthesis lauroyltransferase n=1 Tax=Mesonia oceanica TaxID=2687242 RepID=A0AC61Y6Q1_9FLAO|nr:MULTISPECIES: lysophospholipid acyltransferase family protein [Mesonia]MAN28339.1 lipid A biosynthesis acyltransferase [Mesonia sp.]VVV00172.1 Lipid A biosynthesis lauroyltransferase [Mesonia oceanica]|tara:strand:+ start:33978 stop:34853 length:876 start_codon:yes stop_codon:yes gene_type:complete
MKKAVFYCSYPLLWLVSKLPFPIFYWVSDGCYLLVYYLIGYRKKVVRNNLQQSFPQKSLSEIKQIEKKFYKHMCDIFLEMIKTLSISNKQLKKRFVYENIEELVKFEKECNGAIVMCGHYASYEWATAINFYDTHNKAYAIYKKIKNNYFDKLIKDIRANLGTTLITSKEVIPTMMRNKVNHQKASYYMISDQSPRNTKNACWVDFMGKETAAFTGSESMAKKLGFGILYLQIRKVKRGYYSAKLIPLTATPKDYEDFKITEKFFQLLEAQIREQPEYYLWTHKRWKHKRF